MSYVFFYHMWSSYSVSAEFFLRMYFTLSWTTWNCNFCTSKMVECKWFHEVHSHRIFSFNDVKIILGIFFSDDLGQMFKVYLCMSIHMLPTFSEIHEFFLIRFPSKLLYFIFKKTKKQKPILPEQNN